MGFFLGWFVLCSVFLFPSWRLPAICSSRDVVAFQSPFQITDIQVLVPSKYLPGREAAGGFSNLCCCFSDSSCCFAACWYRGRDAGGAWPGEGMLEQQPQGALRGRNQFCLCNKEENLGTAALKDQDFLKKEQNNMESERGSEESGDSLCRRERTVGKGKKWKNMEGMENCMKSRQ